MIKLSNNKYFIILLILIIILTLIYFFVEFSIQKNNLQNPIITKETIKFNIVKDSEFVSKKILSYSDDFLTNLRDDIIKIIPEDNINLIVKKLNYDNNFSGFYVSYFLDKKLEDYYFDVNFQLYKENWKIINAKRVDFFGVIEAENENNKIIFNINNTKDDSSLIFVEIYTLNKN